MINYVAGFMFSHDRTHVALVKKKKPDFLSGFFNGIGGKIEIDEHPITAMVREFQEETGVKTTTDQWNEYCHLTIDSPNRFATCTFFAAFTNSVFDCRTIESEEIHIVKVSEAFELNLYYNLHWLIPLALDEKNVSVQAIQTKP